MDNIHILMKELIEEKRHGNYLNALIIAGKILEIDPYFAEAYYSMGKIYYLLEDYFASIKNYLISLHLDILTISEDNNEISGFNVLLKDVPKDIINKLDKIDEKSKFILIKRNCIIHIGHSMNRLLNDNFPERTYIDTYKHMLCGEAVNINDNYQKLENNYFFIIGLDFTLNTLDFPLSKNNIKSVYFNKDENKYMHLIIQIHNKIKTYYNN